MLMNDNARQPSFFLPHGGGARPLLNDPSHTNLIEFLRKDARDIVFQSRPKAILIITAHWETAGDPAVSSLSTAVNGLTYDDDLFPRSKLDVDFPARGAPDVAARVVQLLRSAGFHPTTDSSRGWDHGVFVPAVLMFDGDYDTPIVSMSVVAHQDAALHYAMGRALQPLRDEGVAIVGSGLSFHNFEVFGKAPGGFPKPDARIIGEDFDEALAKVCANEDEDHRGQLFAKWHHTLPGAMEAHPVDEADHFMPLAVCAGAGGSVAGQKVFGWECWGTKQSAFLWS
ncbi:hypothetical protein HKX48_009161 [Thoreauomyces humboldtii]|nr:hypothetical protein HKX48_009161 [Thoreauomyces humboldtii]